MDYKSYDYGFQLGWYGVVNPTRRAYATMRAAIVDALPRDMAPKARRQILDALNEFQRKTDWEFDVS